MRRTLLRLPRHSSVTWGGGTRFRVPESRRIQFDTVLNTTSAALNAIQSHYGPVTDRRIREEEFAVDQVGGRIARVKRERDRDIHIVLEDPAEPRQRIVVESD